MMPTEFSPMTDQEYEKGYMPEIAARVLLSLMFEPGDRVVNATLSSYLGSASRMVDALFTESSDINIIAPSLVGVPKPTFAEFKAVCQSILDNGITVTIPGDELWPQASFAALHMEKPYLLYTKGNAGILGWRARIGVIGTRAATSYGEHVTMQFANEFSYKGYVTVATGSYGIAAMAVRAALANARLGAGQGVMIVLPSGLAPMVPSGHAELFESVVESKYGVIVSEMPPGTTPTTPLYNRRHMLVAALSNALVVIESGVRSGTTETLRFADALGRPRFAVPGPITSVTSTGNHRAIKSGLASIASDPSDVITGAEAYLTNQGA